MTLERTTEEKLYEALVARDPAFDGFAFVGVKSTGIFCRLTCPSRKPKRENTVFFDSISKCLEAGYRPCKRCHPLAVGREDASCVRKLTEALDTEPDRRWSEADLVEMGLDPSTVRRTFKRVFGVTFLSMARLRRIGRAAEDIAAGSRVIEAQVGAGFASGSGFRAAFTRLLGHPPKEQQGRDVLKSDWIATPIGTMVAVADSESLHLLEFIDRRALPSELERLQRVTRSGIGIGRVAPIDQIERELGSFFRGVSANFQTPVSFHGTPFTREVWNALLEIPAGETRSYADLAKVVGRPTAVRAVGRANGSNPISILVPCHRLIGSDGTLVGYGGGLWRKRWLLAHETKFRCPNIAT